MFKLPLANLVSSNDSFVVVCSEKRDAEGNSVTQLYNPMVTFENVFDEYPMDVDLIARISYHSTFRKSPHDTVIVVPVGWVSFEQAVCTGEITDNFVRFNVKDLPKANDHFHQIVYCIIADKSVMGISEPFCFEEMSEEKLVGFMKTKDYSSLINEYRMSLSSSSIPIQDSLASATQPSSVVTCVTSPSNSDSIHSFEMVESNLSASNSSTVSVDKMANPIALVLQTNSSTSISDRMEELVASVIDRKENSNDARAKSTASIHHRNDDNSANAVVQSITSSLTSVADEAIVKQISEEIEKLKTHWNKQKEDMATELESLRRAVSDMGKRFAGSDSDSSDSVDTSKNLTSDYPTVYGITATFARPEQQAVLTSLSHTLRMVRHFHWIVVEASSERTSMVSTLLKESGISYTHLAVCSPAPERRILPDSEYVVQRNVALHWLRQNGRSRGVVYFIDDYKIYSLKVFEEMRTIKKVGVWPVGLAGGLEVEKPILSPVTQRVVGWNSRWRPDRLFPLDATGFAVNLSHLIAHPAANFSLDVEPAMRLSAFLSQLVSVSELEPKAGNCSEPLVWCIRIVPPNIR